MLKRSLVVLLLVSTTSFRYATAQPINWKPYFTLDPEEGTSFVYDTTAIERNAGVPKLLVTTDGRLVLAYGAGPEPRTSILEENGRTVRPVTDLSAPQRADGGFIYLPDGRIRYVTEEPSPGNTPQVHRSRIVSFLSSDGLNWSREPGIRYQPGIADDSISGVPSVIQVDDSIWRMYYVGDFYRNNGVRTAISHDWGMSWQSESNGNVLRRGDVDPHPVYLGDGRIRLYHRAGFVPSERVDPALMGIAYTDSPDGLTFDTLTTRLLISDTTGGGGAKLDPAVIRFPNGDIACFLGVSFTNDPGRSKLAVAWAAGTNGVGRESGRDVQGLKLDATYPNPVVGSSSIVFTIPSMGHVSLKVFSPAGDEVARLVDEVRSAGTYTASFPAERLGAGAYVVVLTHESGHRLRIVSVM